MLFERRGGGGGGGGTPVIYHSWHRSICMSVIRGHNSPDHRITNSASQRVSNLNEFESASIKSDVDRGVWTSSVRMDVTHRCAVLVLVSCNDLRLYACLVLVTLRSCYRNAFLQQERNPSSISRASSFQRDVSSATRPAKSVQHQASSINIKRHRIAQLAISAASV